jgi:TPR repeat protein
MLRISPILRTRFTVLAALALATALPACGGALSGQAAVPPTDDQACAERALRGSAHPELLPEARARLATACRQGEASECSILGVMYELGRGAVQDPNFAASLYERSCRLGSARGCVNLGALSLVGGPVPKSAVQAAVLFDVACRDGSAEGCFRLAQLNERGEGVRQSSQQAAALFGRSCASGHAVACSELGAMHERGHGAARDGRRAKELYALACGRGDATGCFMLDRIFAENRVVARGLEPAGAFVAQVARRDPPKVIASAPSP